MKMLHAHYIDGVSSREEAARTGWASGWCGDAAISDAKTRHSASNYKSSERQAWVRAGGAGRRDDGENQQKLKQCSPEDPDDNNNKNNNNGNSQGPRGSPRAGCAKQTKKH